MYVVILKTFFFQGNPRRQRSISMEEYDKPNIRRLSVTSKDWEKITYRTNEWKKSKDKHCLLTYSVHYQEKKNRVNIQYVEIIAFNATAKNAFDNIKYALKTGIFSQISLSLFW